MPLPEHRKSKSGKHKLKSGFLEKLVARLDRVVPGDVQQVVTRLIREKGFLEKVFEALHEGVIILDPNGVIGFVNRAACQFFGLDVERALGAEISSQIRGLDWDSLGKPGRTISRDLEVFYPENRFLNFYLAPIDDAEDAGEPLGFVMLVRDLTVTRAEAEETLESERLNALTLLAAGVAHEIGNPLNSLDIHLQLLGRKLRKLPPGDRKPLEENLSTAREEIRRLDMILKQFLHAVRPTTPHRERTDLHAVLHETLKLLEPELAARKISVRLDLAESMPPVTVDPGQFQQAFYNVIRNASQAVSGEGGSITLRTRVTDFEYVISIEDNGTGISPEHMGAIFEPYRTTKSSGSGLGLLIVRRIIREHGGEIEIESRENEGTRVLIHLPRLERAVRLLGPPESDPVIDL
ncbi:two-component system sensor histidine kinase NtrB [Luteolibacter yonseiensis]|uniref:two-component system sensor histidine kinase NtrB n=1 Tax=Luteolibacter yonseiensis TaxID=1144680 RepID=UPI001F34341C|nr:ATP-binding protein [Luteolibacter yonseiensis]